MIKKEKVWQDTLHNIYTQIEAIVLVIFTQKCNNVDTQTEKR